MDATLTDTLSNLELLSMLYTPARMTEQWLCP